MAVLADWSTSETSQGGWVEAVGMLDRPTYLAHPDVVREGAELMSYLRETGQVIFWGTLATPNDNGGVIRLRAEGPFRLAQHEVDRIFFGAFGTEGWAPPEADTQGRHRPRRRPVAVQGAAAGVGVANGTYRYRTTFVTAEGETRSSPRSDAVVVAGGGGPWTVDVDLPDLPGWASAVNLYRTEDGGTDYKFVDSITDGSTSYPDTQPDVALGATAPTSFQAAELTGSVHGDKIRFEVKRGATVYAGQQAWLVFPAPRQEISGLAFNLDPTRDSDKYLIRVYEADDEDSPWSLTDSWVLDDVDGEISVALTNNDSSLIGIAFERLDDVVNAQHFAVDVSGIAVYGIAPDDDYTCSDGARELFARMGVSDREVEECGVKMLPADFKGGDYAAAMDWLCALTGFCWGIYRNRGELVGWFRPYGQDVWEVVDPEQVRNLDEQERYSRAVVSWDRADGTQGHVDAIADPNPLGYIRTAPVFHINKPMSTEQAEILAQQLADYVSQDHRSGSATLSRVYRNGIPYPAQVIKPGDRLYWPVVNLTLDVVTQSKGEGVLQVTFPDGIPHFDRFLAGQNQAEARRAR